MGATASVNSDTPDVQLVHFTNREQFLKDCSHFYDTMQSCDGTVQKARIYSVLNGLHQASEILNVFMVRMRIQNGLCFSILQHGS